MGAKKPKNIPKAVLARPINWFKYKYGRDFLAANGPIIFASVTLPRVTADALQAAGQPVPVPVVGVLLVDTGATLTAISQKAAAALGLLPTRTADGYGAGGKHSNPVYFAAIEISIGDGVRETVFGWEAEMQGIPDLEQPAAAAGIMAFGRPVEMIGLLGRDMLRSARMEYDGLTGEFKMRFDLNSMGIVPTVHP